MIEMSQSKIKELKELYELRKEEYTNVEGNEIIKAQYRGALYVTERIIKDLEELSK